MRSTLRLRRLRPPETKQLRARLKDHTLAVRVHQRYRVIEALRDGHAPVVAAERIGCHVSTVVFWGRRFNRSGFRSFERASNPKGRPPVVLARQLRALVDVALSSPRARGLPFSAWSVPKLAAYCRAQGILPPVTDEWVRRLLRREGFTAQRVRTWKVSSDPAFERKKTPSAASIVTARRARPWSASTSGGRWK